MKRHLTIFAIATIGFMGAFMESKAAEVTEGAGNGQADRFIVITKKAPTNLAVYEVAGKDTVLLKQYPACVGKNKGQKTISGDMKTPECAPGKSFTITQIVDSSNWKHDFGDGRGEILSYGHWFMRLGGTGFKGIGIHGSTNNRESLKAGRGSEGCIRLYDEDIIDLHDNYAKVGMKVIVLPD